MIARWSKALVTLDDLVAFRARVEALRSRAGKVVALPPRLTLRGAACDAVRERFVLGDYPSDPRRAARRLDGMVQMHWSEPELRGTLLLRQAGSVLTDAILDNSTRRAAGLAAGLYGCVVSDKGHVVVLALNPPSAGTVESHALPPLPETMAGLDQRLAV